MKKNIFERVEKKYLATPDQCRSFLSLTDGRLRPDRYAAYTICNLYYDTDRYDLIRPSLDKPLYKEKLRMRSYGRAEADSPVYLELKKSSWALCINAGPYFRTHRRAPLPQARTCRGPIRKPCRRCGRSPVSSAAIRWRKRRISAMTVPPTPAWKTRSCASRSTAISVSGSGSWVWKAACGARPSCRPAGF